MRKFMTSKKEIFIQFEKEKLRKYLRNDVWNESKNFRKVK